MKRTGGRGMAIVAALGALALLGAWSSPARAQSAFEPRFAVDGRLGIAVPFGGLGDLEDMGLGAGIGGAYWFNPRFAVRADWSLDALNGNSIPAGQSFRDLNLWHYTAGMEANLAPPVSGNVKFTVNGGLGLTRVDFNGGGPTHSYFTMTGGAKLSVPVSPQVDVFGAAQLNVAFSSKNDVYTRDAGTEIATPLGTSTLWSLPLY
ncbi:MAG TPA: outer membrane beta-barrel protein, partial [Gemmatimonadota bacterium]|nr:outer membrane beta-barrel protein [Gemmatimonadota bacterium]